MGERETHSYGRKIPEEFGKYSILEHIATGGMAEVYLARQTGLEGFEKLVVIKRIRPELTDPETTAFFLDEARLVATLEHPNIAQVYEIGLVNGSYFFVMEYVHGADLRHLMEAALLRNQEVSLANAVSVIVGVCAALHYAHEKCDLDGRHVNIIHRDVSPSNVLISHDGAIKVCDFGIAKATSRTLETSRGTLKGKFGYMSPEQCKSEQLDRRSDVFSIGILLYELTTLTRLFTGNSDYELLCSIVEAPIPPPSSRILEYPAELERIVLKALSRDRARRYPTAQAMQLDLEAFARERRLAMSPINIATLMGQLFEKRTTTWHRGARTTLADDSIDTPSPTHDSARPLVLPPGSGPEPDIEIETNVEIETPATVHGPLAPHRVSMAESTPAAPRRRNAIWLVGAALAGLVTGAIAVAENLITRTESAALLSALEQDAERIGAMLDTSARAAHMRADGVAGAPMLRAAIETDAATVHDIFASEMMFTPARGEVLEVFQLQGTEATSLLRVPATGASTTPLLGRESRLEVRDREIFVTIGAPVVGYKGKLGGVLNLTQAVDLAAVTRRIKEHTTEARVVGLQNSLVIESTGRTTEPSITVAIPSSGESTSVPLTLVVTPKPATAVSWLPPVGYSTLGIAVLFLVFYVAGFWRRP